MAADPVTVGIAVGVTCFILLIIIVVVVYLIFCKKKSKAKGSSGRTGSQSFSPYQNTTSQTVQVPAQVPPPTPPPTPPITYVSPQVSPYSYYNNYITAADYRGQLPTSLWYPSQYRALGASEDTSSTQTIQPGVLRLGDKTVPLYMASKDGGGTNTASNAFILPELPKSEQFILPFTTNDLDPPKDTFSNFILPTDKAAIIDEFGSEDFILPEIDWNGLSGKKDEVTYQPKIGPDVPGESSSAANGLLNEALIGTPNVGSQPDMSSLSSYNPYAPIPPVSYGKRSEKTGPADEQASSKPYNPYSSYQPYGPASPPTQPTAGPVRPDQTAEASSQQQRPEQTNTGQVIAYYVVTNEAKPNEQQQQQPETGKVDKPAASQPTALFQIVVDSTGASVPTTSPPAAQPVSGNENVPGTPTASYQGYAIYQQTSCVTNPENSEETSCKSMKNVYHLEAVPDANNASQLVWVADQPQQSQVGTQQQPIVLEIQQ